MKKVFLSCILFLLLFVVGCNTTSKEKIDYVSQVSLPEGYETKSFFKNGIGSVKLKRCVDGDTAHFADENGNYIQARFLGIDTPESTGQIEEYGKQAARYTCNMLSNAKEIILESEGDKPETDSNERYLTYVWADGILVNLSLVQEGLAITKGVSGTKYANYFLDADNQAIKLKLNMRSGEKDSDYYYGDGIITTLKDLRLNPEEYYGKRVAVYGYVTRKLGTDAYIEEYDEATGESYGMYVFTMYKTYKCLAVGNYLKVVGILSKYDVTNSYQIVDVTYNETVPGVNDMQIIETGKTVTAKEIKASDIGTPESNPNIEGTFVKIKNLTGIVGGYNNSETGAITAKAEDEFGNVVTIRIDKKASVKGIKSYTDFVDKNFDLSGLVSVYDGAYQIMLVSKADLNFIQ